MLGSQRSDPPTKGQGNSLEAELPQKRPLEKLPGKQRFGSRMCKYNTSARFQEEKKEKHTLPEKQKAEQQK